MRARRLTVLGVLVLFAIALAVATVALYAERTLFDSGRFADRVEVALEDDDVSREVAGTLTEEIVAARPDLIAVQPLIGGVAEQVVGGSAFRSLAGRAAFESHAAVFDRERDSAVLIVGNGALLVTQALEATRPELAQRVPARLRARLASISDGTLGRAFVDVVQVAEDVALLVWIALALALILLAAALVATPPGERSGTVARAGWAVGAVGALLVVAVQVGSLIVGGFGDTDQRIAALRAVWSAFFGDLAVWGFALAAVGLVVLAAATSRADEPTLARRARAFALRVAARPQGTPLRALRVVGLLALGVLIAVQPLEAVRLLALGAGLFVIALGVDELMAIAPRPAGHAPATADGGPAATAGRGGAGGAPSVRPYAGLIAAAVVAVAVLGAIGVSAATDDTPPEPGCNGADELCERRLDAIAIPATHNSMSSPQDGFLLPNQESGITAQLRGGIRGLLIDMHVGARTPRGIYTLLKEGGKSRAKIEEAIGPEATRTALRLRERIGYRGGGDERVYLCHGFCELGAIDAERALRDVREFLVADPGAVLVISVEDQVTAQQAAAVFERSGLLDYVWKGPVRPVPTLGEMVEAGERVLVVGEEDTEGVPWYHAQFTYVRDTPYDLPSADALLSPRGCTIGRGTDASPFLLMNQFVSGDPPLPRPARIVNRRAAILAHARECRRSLGGLPGLIAVDFWEQGDVVGASRELNGIG
ncbi:MAG TPA: hypothetical protein VK506_06230 [Conexibacter sp.]|nr:hypothetical protein [Conexibacter sp.]